MTVISGIFAAAKVAIKIAPFVYRASKITYKAASKTKHGAQWMRRHPKIVKYGTVAAGGASLLLDLTNIDYSAITPQIRSPTVKQTRGNFQRSRSRFKCKPDYYPGYRNRRSR